MIENTNNRLYKNQFFPRKLVGRVTEYPGTEPNSKVLFDVRQKSYRATNYGHRTSDIGHCTLDTVHWTPDTTSGIRKLDHKLRKSEVIRKQEQQMVLKYKYIELTTCKSFQCPVSDVQLASVRSDVRCPAT